MQSKAFIIAACLTTTAAAPPSDVPEDLAVAESWSNNSDGYVSSTGYFTPEQVQSEAWERARLRRGTPQYCVSEHLVHRDVRWFEPIAQGEPRCAIIVYSVACSEKHPNVGSSLEYARQQALLDDPPSLPSTGCGEKDRKKLSAPLDPVNGLSGPVISPLAHCETLPDIQAGNFVLGPVNYVRARSFVSPSFLRDVPQAPQGNPAQQIAFAAWLEQKVHLVVTRRELPDDGQNIFIDQTAASNGNRLCITLTAQQGKARWRKSVQVFFRTPPGDQPATESKPPDQYAIAKALQLDLARYMGIKISTLQQPAPE
jgi:hypothetical protein